MYNQFYHYLTKIDIMHRLTASSADHFFSKSTEDERHVEGDLICTEQTNSKHRTHIKHHKIYIYII